MAQDPLSAPGPSAPASAVPQQVCSSPQPDPAWLWTLPTRPACRSTSWPCLVPFPSPGRRLMPGAKGAPAFSHLPAPGEPHGYPPVLESSRPWEPSAPSVSCHTPGFRKNAKIISGVVCMMLVSTHTEQTTFPPLLPALGCPYFFTGNCSSFPQEEILGVLGITKPSGASVWGVA